MAAEHLPPVTYRVAFWEGFGWPECTHRQRTVRRFDTQADVVRMLQTIDRRPDHHKLIGVWVTACRWVEVQLPAERATLADSTDPQEDEWTT